MFLERSLEASRSFENDLDASETFLETSGSIQEGLHGRFANTIYSAPSWLENNSLTLAECSDYSA